MGSSSQLPALFPSLSLSNQTHTTSALMYSDSRASSLASQRRHLACLSSNGFASFELPTSSCRRPAFVCGTSGHLTSITGRSLRLVLPKFSFPNGFELRTSELNVTFASNSTCVQWPHLCVRSTVCALALLSGRGLNAFEREPTHRASWLPPGLKKQSGRAKAACTCTVYKFKCQVMFSPLSTHSCSHVWPREQRP